MSIPLRQALMVGAYVLKQRLQGRKRFPLVLMLEPLFRCNLACAGCGKIQHPTPILRQNLSPEACFQAVEECGAPVVSIAGGEPLLHPQIDEIAAGLVVVPGTSRQGAECERPRLVSGCSHGSATDDERSISLVADGDVGCQQRSAADIVSARASLLIAEGHIVCDDSSAFVDELALRAGADHELRRLQQATAHDETAIVAGITCSPVDDHVRPGQA